MWDNVGKTFPPEDLQSTWCTVVHDIFPNRVQLFKIHLHATDACPRCDQTDTLIHGVTTCGAVTDIWQWTRIAVVMMMRIAPRYVPCLWLVFPNLALWPKAKHNAILLSDTWCTIQSMQKQAFRCRNTWKSCNERNGKFIGGKDGRTYMATTLTYGSEKWKDGNET